jgi:hypothetical protein
LAIFLGEWSVIRHRAAAIYAIKAYRGSRDIAPIILNLDNRYRLVVNSTPRPLYPWESDPVPIVQEDG